MNGSKIHRNTYEVDPEQLRSLVTKGSDEKGRKPRSRKSRPALLQIHEENVKSLGNGILPVRTFILPQPYPPSRITLQDDYEKVHLSDLLIDTRSTNSVLFLRVITTPYIYSSTVTIVEDENGDVAKLTVNNLEDNPVDPILAEGSLLAVKQSCWSKLLEGEYHIRIDHPSDLIVLDGNDETIPQIWKQDERLDNFKDAGIWKKEGDLLFLKKKFRQALGYYDRGLTSLTESPDPIAEIDLYRKRCGVNIILLRLDDAAADLSKAISTHFRSSSTPLSAKLTVSDIDAWLHSRTTADTSSISTSIPRPLKELAARIKFDLGVSQSTPEYNIPLISSYVGPLTLHVDAANYTCDTEIGDTSNRGRGLYARRAFKMGEIITAEKAFVLPGYFMNDRSSDCMLYDLEDGSASPRPGALLFKELVQKLRWNKSLRSEFFALDDGGYWATNGHEIGEGEDIPVDVFRVEQIRRLNSFSSPTHSTSLLHASPNANPELRNGFWIHASYVNHSCLPNAVRSFIGDVRFMRATRDIAAGDEITNQYVAPDVDLNARQQLLKEGWGFECGCDVCLVDGRVAEDARRNRVKVFEQLKEMVIKLGNGDEAKSASKIKKIARVVRELEALYTPTDECELDPYAELPRLVLVHPTLFLTEAWRSIGNVDKMIDCAVMLLRNFGIFTAVEGKKFRVVRSSGMVNVETVRALKYLREGYTKKGEEEIAAHCMDTGRRWFSAITGTETGFEKFFDE